MVGAIRKTISKSPITQMKRSRLSPAKTLILGFVVIIFVGAVLLHLPFAAASGHSTNFLTSLFTATSAICVTGLVVVDTGTYWSFWGQLMILILIQIGGLGFMTMATMLFILMGKRIGLKERILIRESLNQVNMAGIVRLVRAILIFTFATEGAFTIILSWRWFYDFGWPRCLWFGFFHAISAFNNAGFDLFGSFQSLTTYVNDPVVVFSISTLIIFGGIGFSVAMNIFRWREKSLSLHSRLTLLLTLLLIAGGFLFFLLFEWSFALSSFSLPQKFLAAYFQSVTARTAGYNTVDISGLRAATQFLLIILMFIGASPGSTGGGIKTTTFGLLVIAVWSLAQGDENTKVMRRRVLSEQVYKALAVFLLAMALVTGITLILNVTEKTDFLAILFETVSAFGTVGLSMGLTPELTVLGKLLIIATMFSGRLGPLTLVFALAQKKRRSLIKYPKEKVLIG